MRLFSIVLCFCLCWPVAGRADSSSGSLSGKINAFIADKRTPGLVLMVAKNGKVLLHEAYGYADIERRRPLRTDDIFRLYSMSKPITAAGVLKLVERGELTFATRLHEVLHEFERQPPISLHQLLTHTAGFAYGGSWTSITGWRYWLANPLDQRGKTLQEMITTLAGLPLMYRPGSQWLYSVASDVQGAVIEKASGRPLARYLAEALFEPLGMRDTGFFVEPARQHRLVPQYQYDTGGKFSVPDDEEDLFKHPPKLVSGGGGLVGTAQDYMRFVQMLLHPPSGHAVLSPGLIRQMTSNQLPGVVRSIPSEVYTNSGFGFGLGVKLEDERYLGRGSFYWAGSGGTLFWADPNNGVAVVAMMQLQGARAGLEKRLVPWVYEWLKQQES